MNESNKLLSDIVAFRTYAKHISHLQRRETLAETTNRTMNLFLDRFPKLSSEIVKAFSLVHDLKVMPSMRLMQFAGEAVLLNNARTYNCSFVHMKEPRIFQEVLYLLLSGTGVGYSVQKRHINQLPTVRAPKEEGYFRVHDSIEGWADALGALINAYLFSGIRPDFDFSAIRPKGSYLVTTGAKAPGPEPLRHMLSEVDKKLKMAVGRKLRSLEVHDINCLIADCVLAGGIRRAAMISLFDADEKEMLACKAGTWWEKAPYRARANNSVVLHREHTTKEEFTSIMKACQDSNAGEPGFFWTNDYDHGTNPSLRKGTRVLTDSGVIPIDQLEGKKFKVPNLNGEWSDAKCWLSGKDISLWELTLDTGEKYYASPEHKWPIYVNGRYVKCESQDLKAGDILPINVFNRKELFSNPNSIGTSQQGFLIGWLYGDGSITTRKDTEKNVCSFIVSKKDGKNILDGLLEEIEKIDGVKDRSVYNRGECFEFQVGNKAFIDWLESFGVSKKENGLPTKIWTDWSEECRRGFIDGLFSSDGHIPTDSHGVSLISSRYNLIKDVQDLLGFYGIKCSLTKKVQKSPSFPNGKTYDKEYTCYTLKTTVTGRVRFAEFFPLSVEYKNELLQKTSNFKTKEQFVVLKEIKLTNLKEDVWDISVNDTTHCFQLPQVTTGNCAEISLNSNQFCNLTSINQTGITTEKEFMKRVKAAAFIGTLQASLTNFPYISEKWRETTEREALLGVSFTGIADSMGFVTPELLKAGAELVKSTNEEVAKKIGINHAARTTAIKPEGCFTPTTKVKTNKGILSLKEIFDRNEINLSEKYHEETTWYDLKDEIKVYDVNNEEQKVTKLFINGIKDTLILEFEHEDKIITIECTPNHKFFTKNRDWVEAKDLKEEDDILFY